MSEDPARYPLEWPAGWKRSTSRSASAFTKKRANGYGYERLEVGDGLRRLLTELRRLGARNPVISSNLRRNLDGSINAGQGKMLNDPGVAVYFRLNDQPRVLACDRWSSAADNMAAIAAHIEAMRAQDRYGVGSLDQAFAGYTALPPVGGTQGGDWRAEFGLAPTAPVTLELVETIYRTLSKQRHPDAGGSHDALVRLNLARDAARKYFGEGPR